MPHTQAICLLGSSMQLYYSIDTNRGKNSENPGKYTSFFSLFLLLFIRNEIISSCVCRALAAFFAATSRNFCLSLFFFDCKSLAGHCEANSRVCSACIVELFCRLEAREGKKLQMKWKLATYNLNVCGVMKGGWRMPRVPPSTQASTCLRPCYITTALWPGACFSHPRKSRPPSVSRFPFRFGFICFVHFAPGWQRLPDSPFIRTLKKITSKQKYITAFGLFVIDLKWLKKIHHIILNAFLRTKGRPIFLSMARGLFIS